MAATMFMWSGYRQRLMAVWRKPYTTVLWEVRASDTNKVYKNASWYLEIILKGLKNIENKDLNSYMESVMVSPIMNDRN